MSRMDQYRRKRLMKLQVGERAKFDGITVSIAVAGGFSPLITLSPATVSV